MASTTGITLGFDDVRQFRVSFEPISAVSLPGALVLMGSALAAAAGGASWRRRRSRLA